MHTRSVTNNPSEGTGNVASITFTALFDQARTTPDKGWKVTLAVSQDEALKITQLAQLAETLLQVAIIPIA